MKVFIENQAGSRTKHRHNEKTFELKGATELSRAYPFPYGFVPKTTAADGFSADCFVLTQKPLRTGDFVECEPIGLMEQIEDGKEDHKILAIISGEEGQVDERVKQTLLEFVSHVFDHIPGKQIRVERFLGREAAIQYMKACADRER